GKHQSGFGGTWKSQRDVLKLPQSIAKTFGIDHVLNSVQPCRNIAPRGAPCQTLFVPDRRLRRDTNRRDIRLCAKSAKIRERSVDPARQPRRLIDRRCNLTLRVFGTSEPFGNAPAEKKRLCIT